MWQYISQPPIPIKASRGKILARTELFRFLAALFWQTLALCRFRSEKRAAQMRHWSGNKRC